MFCYWNINLNAWHHRITRCLFGLLEKMQTRFLHHNFHHSGWLNNSDVPNKSRNLETRNCREQLVSLRGWDSNGNQMNLTWYNNLVSSCSLLALYSRSKCKIEKLVTSWHNIKSLTYHTFCQTFSRQHLPAVANFVRRKALHRCRPLGLVWRWRTALARNKEWHLYCGSKWQGHNQRAQSKVKEGWPGKRKPVTCPNTRAPMREQRCIYFGLIFILMNCAGCTIEIWTDLFPLLSANGLSELI